MGVTTIQLDTKLRDRLKGLGRKGETYGEIIERLIEQAQYVSFMQEQYSILGKEKNWVPLVEI